MSDEPGSEGDLTGQALVARELRRHRESAGLTLIELATRVGYSRTYIATSEKPGAGLVSAAVVKRIDEELGADGVLIAFHARADADRKARRTTTATDSTIERSHLTTVRSSMPSTSLDSAAVGSATLLRDVDASEVDPMTLDEIEERVGALARDYYRMSPALFRSVVIALRERARHLLMVRSRLRQRRRLYAALARLTGMLAESSFALGQPTDIHCVAALALGEEAGDAEVVGWVRGTQAQIALHTGSPSAAIRYARAGQQAPRGSTARVRSSTYVARASARIGDRAAAQEAWRTAQCAWADLDGALTDSIFSLNPDYLSYCELTVAAWLGDTSQAKRLTANAGWVGNAPTVGRAIGRIDVGLLHLHLGDLDAAVEAGHHALAIGEQRLTTPLLDRFDDLLAVLSTFDAPAA